MQLDLGQKMKLLNEIFTDGYHVKRRLLGATLSSNKLTEQSKGGTVSKRI